MPVSSGLVQLKQLLDAFARPDVNKNLEVVVSESRSEVGGVWCALLITQCMDILADPLLGSLRPGRRGYERAMGKEERAMRCTSPLWSGKIRRRCMRVCEPIYLMWVSCPPNLEFLTVTGPHGVSRLSIPRRDHSLSHSRQVSSVSSGVRRRRIATVLSYLQSYATHFDLHQYIRFNTKVERLYHTPSSSSKPPRRWTIGYGPFREGGSEGLETFDYVTVANGHYSDSWIPPIPGLR